MVICIRNRYNLWEIWIQCWISAGHSIRIQEQGCHILTWQTFCLGFQVCFDELGDDKQQIFKGCAVVVYLLFNYLLCGTKDCFPHRYFSWVLICFRLTSALFWNEDTRDNLRRNWWLLPVTQCNYSAFKGLLCLPVTRRTIYPSQIKIPSAFLLVPSWSCLWAFLPT